MDLARINLKCQRMSNTGLWKGGSVWSVRFDDTMCSQGECGTMPLCVCTCVFRFPTLPFVLMSREEQTSCTRLPLMSFNIWVFSAKEQSVPIASWKARTPLSTQFLAEQLPSTYSPEQLLQMKNIPDDSFAFRKSSALWFHFYLIYIWAFVEA